MTRPRLFPWILLAAGLSLVLAADSIRGSKHDLTHDIAAYGMHGAMMNNYNQVCIYCHTAHNASPTATALPLWNRPNTSVVYTTYSSPTMTTSPGQPGWQSLACLSCHDGTVAVDAVLNQPWGVGGDANGSWNDPYRAHWTMGSNPNGGAQCSMCHDGSGSLGAHNAMGSYLGTDLSNMHPIGMTYPTHTQNPRFFPPPDSKQGWGSGAANDIKLYDGRVECASCHNVHDPLHRPFLRKSNGRSAICLTCHIK